MDSITPSGVRGDRQRPKLTPTAHHCTITWKKNYKMTNIIVLWWTSMHCKFTDTSTYWLEWVPVRSKYIFHTQFNQIRTYETCFFFFVCSTLPWITNRLWRHFVDRLTMAQGRSRWNLAVIRFLRYPDSCVDSGSLSRILYHYQIANVLGPLYSLGGSTILCWVPNFQLLGLSLSDIIIIIIIISSSSLFSSRFFLKSPFST